MLAVNEANTQKEKLGTEKDGPGRLISREDALNMMELYKKRLEKAQKGENTGINSAKEPSQLFFRRDALVGMPDWEYFGIGLALAVRQGINHRPPTVEEMASWEKDPSKVNLVQTVIISETDAYGNFKFREGEHYMIYDFAGQCCNPDFD